MADSIFCVPKTTVYRNTPGQCVAIELNEGRIHYFSEKTETFLDFFKEPRRLTDFFNKAGVATAEEQGYLEEFCQMLVKKRLLITSDREEPGGTSQNIQYEKPAYVREDERRLDEISFACP